MTAATKTRTATLTKHCVSCGSDFTCVNPHGRRARVEHLCGTRAYGPTWTLYAPVQP